MAVRALDLTRSAELSSQPRSWLDRALDRRARLVDLLKAAIVLMLVANLGRLQLFFIGAKDVPLLFNDLLIVGLIVLGSIAVLRRRHLILDGPATAALTFAAVGFLSAVLAIPRFELTGFEFVLSVAFLARWLAYFGVYLLIINFARAEDLRGLWTTFERTLLVFAGFGIFQSAFLPGFAQIVYPDQLWDVQGRRLVSTFLDPNFAGGFIVIGLLVLLARLAFGERIPYWKLILLFAALILTISRSAFLGFVAGVAVIALVRGHSRRLVRFGSLLVLLLIPFVPLIFAFASSFGRFSLEGSAMTRIVLWTRAITIFLDNPVLGIGFNTYSFVQEAYGWRLIVAADSATDGGLLFIAVMTGAVGVSIYIAMLLMIVRRCKRIWQDPRRSIEDRGLSLGITAATAAIVVHSIFLNSLLYHFIMESLWIIWGLSYLMSRPADSPSRRLELRPDLAFSR